MQSCRNEAETPNAAPGRSEGSGELFDLEVTPSDLYAAAVMDLQGYRSVGLTDLFISEVDHGLSVQPCLNPVSLDSDPELIPLSGFQDVLLVVIYLYQPATAV